MSCSLCFGLRTGITVLHKRGLPLKATSDGPQRHYPIGRHPAVDKPGHYTAYGRRSWRGCRDRTGDAAVAMSFGRCKSRFPPLCQSQRLRSPATGNGAIYFCWSTPASARWRPRHLRYRPEQTGGRDAAHLLLVLKNNQRGFSRLQASSPDRPPAGVSPCAPQR